MRFFRGKRRGSQVGRTDAREAAQQVDSCLSRWRLFTNHD